jgi:hypothetical protein
LMLPITLDHDPFCIRSGHHDSRVRPGVVAPLTQRWTQQGRVIDQGRSIRPASRSRRMQTLVAGSRP